MTNSLMAGRRGLIMGVANDHSIAWGIAQQLHKHGECPVEFFAATCKHHVLLAPLDQLRRIADAVS